MENENQACVLSSEERDQRWIELIEECRDSGQSIKEWVRERGEFSYSQYMRARDRLFPDDIRKNGFLENETTWSSINLDIPSSTLDVFVNDFRIVVGAGFDQELLREVVGVLKNAH
ncbi:MAG TPA: hypothetical protein VLQ66_09345 [Paenisporosarcina sp.]|nr:hypothetical protein [Paenisporosarcina sp.]